MVLGRRVSRRNLDWSKGRQRESLQMRLVALRHHAGAAAITIVYRLYGRR